MGLQDSLSFYVFGMLFRYSIFEVFDKSDAEIPLIPFIDFSVTLCYDELNIVVVCCWEDTLPHFQMHTNTLYAIH